MIYKVRFALFNNIYTRKKHTYEEMPINENDKKFINDRKNIIISNILFALFFEEDKYNFKFTKPYLEENLETICIFAVKWTFLRIDFLLI